MTKRFSVACMIILTFILGSFGCAKKEIEEIRIGAVLELTGTLSTYGERSKRGMDLAVEELNSTGGINGKRLAILFEDSRSDPKEGLAAFRKLIDVNRVPVITGLIGSSTVMACAPVANESKVILFSAGATSPLITDSGDYVFRNRLSGSAEVEAMADFAMNKLHIKRLSLLYVNTDYGVGNKEVFEKAYSKLRGKLDFSESFEQGETDFRAQLSRIKAKQSVAVYVIGHVIESASILRQAKELGVRTPFLSTVGIEGPDLWRIAGSAADGVIYTVQNFDPDASESSRKFSQRYREKYGEFPDLFAALGYDAIRILTRVIAQNGYDAEKIKNGLYSIRDHEGVLGKVSFDKNGDILAAVTMKIAKGGKFIPYRP